ncbi:hypothetical protein PCANC_19012 [Puccinia coronata f. sp. avenae]|uniref:DUF659 domain-containing protein n=1 Tax=Puccinia coronata f. sp. avenae TaxID=200324 RepID=A0A2N5UH97_9BASI|nr:hypothetical protein PCANC_19012 [Puccinia coronata f. sp. avenae]
MAGGQSKKRLKATPSSSSSSPSQPSRKNKKQPTVNIINDSEDNPKPTKNDNPDSTQPEPVKSKELTDEQELRRAQKVHKAAISSTYTAYDTPELSDQLDKHGRKMIAYPCKTCGSKIHCPTYDTLTRNLSKHVASCTKKSTNDSKSQTLAAVGVTGTGDIEAREAHRGILHPTVVKNLPSCKAVSDNIAQLYTAVQDSIMESIKSHRGAVYLGLDAWQSPNGFDVLGTVLYQLVERSNGEFELEASPLDFVRLQKSHTGIYLAKTVRLIVEKFGLKDKV